MACLPIFRKKNLLTDELLPKAKPIATLFPKDTKTDSIRFLVRDPSTVTSIILHSTEKRKATDYLRLSLENQFMIHVLIDKSGEIYAAPDFLKKIFTASPGIDEVSIHIA